MALKSINRRKHADESAGRGKPSFLSELPYITFQRTYGGWKFTMSQAKPRSLVGQ